MVRAGEVAGSYRAAVARAVAVTQAFIVNPSHARFQIAARSLEDALSRGLILSGVPKEDIARLAALAVANCGSEVVSPKSLRARRLPAPSSPMPRGLDSPAPRHIEPDIVTQLRVEYAFDSGGVRSTNLPRPIGAPDREGK
ncbi:hypothetical protein Isolate57596_50500 (plasmid) [Mycobacteroides abscessus subsp. abscessus]